MRSIECGCGKEAAQRNYRSSDERSTIAIRLVEVDHHTVLRQKVGRSPMS